MSIEQVLEEADYKLQNAFVLRLELSRQAGENAIQPFGDIFAVLVSVYGKGFSTLPQSEAAKKFNQLRAVALEVIDHTEKLVNEDRSNV